MSKRTELDNEKKKKNAISDYHWWRSIWRDGKPAILSALGLITLILGTDGFQQLEINHGNSPRWIDSLYRAFNLFGFGSGNLPVPFPWQLEISRWTGPFATILAFVMGILALLHQQTQLFSLRFGRKHVIVCGLGRTGFQLIKNLRQAGNRVIVIEKNSQSQYLDTCKDLGAIVITGDARDRYTLQKARVDRADCLIALSGEDIVNLEILEQARNLAQKNKNNFSLRAQIDDIQLFSLVRTQLFPPQSGILRFDFFNILDSWAMGILRKYPISIETGKILILGLNDLSEQIIINVSRQWCLSSQSGKIPVVIVDSDPKKKMNRIFSQFPIVNENCHFSFIEESSEFPQNSLEKSILDTEFSHCFVCYPESTKSMQTGIFLSSQISSKNTKIIVRINGEPGISKNLNAIQSENKLNLFLFDCLDNIFTQDLIRYGNNETLARIIHENYVENQLIKNPDKSGSSSLQPWEKLDENYKVSNRSQADRIGLKLSAIGCTIIPWIHSGAEKFDFSQEEIEYLARKEHEWWCEERISNGWKYGDVRDDKKRIHPSLIPWDDPRFADEEKQKDRDTVSHIPEYLALIGFEITRYR